MGHGERVWAISGRAFPHFRLRAGTVLLLALLITQAMPAWNVRAAESEPAAGADIYTKMLRRYDALNAELTHALNEIERGGANSFDGPALSSPARVLSMRGNASVTIGGELRATYAYARSSGRDPGFDPAPAAVRRQDGKTGAFSLPTARLSIDARMGDRWRAYLDINLHGHSGFHRVRQTVNPNPPGTNPPARDYAARENDLAYLNQAYIELMKGDHSGFGAILGKVKLPFGLWQKPNLYAQSFLDAPDLTGSYLMLPAGWDSGVRLPHASRLLDPALAAMIYYEMRDIVRFDAAVFQERDPGSGGDALVRFRDGGTQKIRSGESAPRSWQAGVSLQPLENWELTAHFRNRYSRTRGIGGWTNSPFRWDFAGNMAGGGGDPRWDGAPGQWADGGDGEAFGSRKNEQALVVGVAVEVPSTNLSITAEYAHGWNQGFNRHINSDSASVGFAYALTPRLTVHAQGEWLHVKDRSWMAETASGWARDTRNNHLYRAMLGAEYDLAGFMTLEAGWQYEYWRAKSSVLGESRLTTANMFYFGTRFIF